MAEAVAALADADLLIAPVDDAILAEAARIACEGRLTLNGAA